MGWGLGRQLEDECVTGVARRLQGKGCVLVVRFKIDIFVPI